MANGESKPQATQQKAEDQPSGIVDEIINWVLSGVVAPLFAGSVIPAVVISAVVPIIADFIKSLALTGQLRLSTEQRLEIQIKVIETLLKAGLLKGEPSKEESR
jgi:Na+/H+-dicarboxylate symporter